MYTRLYQKLTKLWPQNQGWYSSGTSVYRYTRNGDGWNVAHRSKCVLSEWHLPSISVRSLAIAAVDPVALNLSWFHRHILKAAQNDPIGRSYNPPISWSNRWFLNFTLEFLCFISSPGTLLLLLVHMLNILCQQVWLFNVSIRWLSSGCKRTAIPRQQIWRKISKVFVQNWKTPE